MKVRIILIHMQIVPMVVLPVQFRVQPLVASLRLVVAGGVGIAYIAAPSAAASDAEKNEIENILVTGVQDDGLKPTTSSAARCR